MSDMYASTSNSVSPKKSFGLGTFVLILFLLLCVGSIGVIYTGFKLLEPVSTDSTPIAFVIPKGQSVSLIAERLHEQGLITHPLLFRLVVKYQGIESKLQAGSFEISPSQSLLEIATALTQGTEDIWVTLLEGWRTEEVAEYLSSQELQFFEQDEFLILAQDTPGRLFPDTYLVPREITATQLHNLLVSTFESKVIEDLESEIANNPRDFEDILIMASLVEREARDYEQMRHVAGILWNRIDIGMALQVDATLQYARGFDAQNDSWWSPPRVSDKTSTSPYNTYQTVGLPPGPISNPGLNAIKATLDPIASNDLFYLHARTGEMYYAESLPEHNANIDRYLR
ncbi:MAG: endolytic transglycosylase MltG [Microgenomates group bacterium]